MIHIITEDSAGGLQFWETVIRAFNIEGSIQSTFGFGGFNTSIVKIYSDLLEVWGSLTEHDSLIICYDMLNRQSLNYDVIRSAFKHCPARVYVSNYLCIESLVLSFSLLEGWLGLDSGKAISSNVDSSVCYTLYHELLDKFELRAKELKKHSLDPKYSNCILGCGVSLEGFDVSRPRSLNTAVLKYLRMRRDKGAKITTTEQFLSDLLSMLTERSGFRVDKSRWYECWFKDCCWDILELNGRTIERRFAKSCEQLNELDKSRVEYELSPSGATCRDKLRRLLQFSEPENMFQVVSDKLELVSLLDIIEREEHTRKDKDAIRDKEYLSCRDTDSLADITDLFSKSL